MDGNGCGWKGLKMVGDGRKWLEMTEMARHGWKWLEMTGMARNGWKGLEMAGNGWICLIEPLFVYKADL